MGKEKLQKLKDEYDKLRKWGYSEYDACIKLRDLSEGGFDLGEGGYPTVFYSGDYLLVISSGATLYKEVKD